MNTYKIPIVKGARINGNEVTYSRMIEIYLRDDRKTDFYFLSEDIEEVKVDNKDAETLTDILRQRFAIRPVIDDLRKMHKPKEVLKCHFTEEDFHNAAWDKLDRIMEKYL